MYIIYNIIILCLNLHEIKIVSLKILFKNNTIRELLNNLLNSSRNVLQLKEYKRNKSNNCKRTLCFIFINIYFNVASQLLISNLYERLSFNATRTISVATRKSGGNRASR